MIVCLFRINIRSLLKLTRTSIIKKEDGEGMDGPGREEVTDKSFEAAVAAAAAAGQTGTSAAAAAAYVAAAHSKQSSQRGTVGSRHELRMEHNYSTMKATKANILEPFACSNLELVSSDNKGVRAMERNSAISASRHRKRSGSKAGNGNNPGSPGSMGSRYFSADSRVTLETTCLLLHGQYVFSPVKLVQYLIKSLIILRNVSFIICLILYWSMSVSKLVVCCSLYISFVWL